ncbi:MAG: hypothetical protein ACKOZZ_09675, partial [Bacteroidota bacterium]
MCDYRIILTFIFLLYHCFAIGQSPCFTVTSSTTPSCPGEKTGRISLTISGGSGSFLIYFNGSTSATTQTVYANYPAGIYTFRVSDTKNANCDRSFTATITNYSVPRVTISGNSTFCSGQTISLTANLDKVYQNPYTYLWSNGRTGSTINFVPTSGGTINVTVTDAVGCSVNAATSVSQVAGPSVSFSGSYTNCPGKDVTLVPTISGGTAPYTYSWDGVISATSSKTVSPTTAQTYCLTVKDANNCSGQACVVVNQRSLNVTLPTGVSICQGEIYTLKPTVGNFSGVLSYQWSNGSKSESISFPVNSTQTYSVTVTDGTGCTGISSTSIAMVPNPVINLPTSVDVCQSNSVTLDTKLSASMHLFRWSTGATSSAITLSPMASVTISVTVTNINKCQQSASVNVNVKPNPSISLPTSLSACANTPFTLSPT